MHRITKQFTFSASHQLHGLPQWHQCARLHGHNYRIEVILRAKTLDQTGFVLDYGRLDFIKTMIEDRLEHRHLNDLFVQPSAENIAYWLFVTIKVALDQLRNATDGCWSLEAVRVSETDRTWAEYRQDD